MNRFPDKRADFCKWKHRDTLHDRSHTPHRLQTTLTPAQEAVAVALRQTLPVLISDLRARAIASSPMANGVSDLAI